MVGGRPCARAEVEESAPARARVVPCVCANETAALATSARAAARKLRRIESLPEFLPRPRSGRAREMFRAPARGLSPPRLPRDDDERGRARARVRCLKG